MGISVDKDTLASFFDAGSFVEIGACLKRAGQEETESVLCGYGAVEGKLAFAFAEDSARMKGAFDEYSARKIKMLYDAAMKNGAPVVGLFDSDGAVIYEGSTALAAYGTFLRCASDASGVVPQIAVIAGNCTGMSAAVAKIFDFTVAVKEVSRLSVNAPFLIGEDAAKTDYAAAQGNADLIADDLQGALDAARGLLALLPSNNAEGNDIDDSAASNPNTPAGSGVGGDDGLCQMEALADGGRVTELQETYAPEMLTALGRMGGVTVGFVGNNGTVKEGTLTGNGTRKAARFINFCDAFGIPVITLVNSTGTEVSRPAEDANLAASLAVLTGAYSASVCPKLTVVTGKAYGAAFTVMGSKALGADLAYALPEAEIGVLSPARAVAFVWNEKVTAATSRETLEAEWKEKYGTAQVAAEHGDIDDVVEADELRAKLCAGLYMLLRKSGDQVTRRHANLPL